ncbi:MAG: hypothetical protein ABSB40_14035, partial [Nitrososphaeria archaeon]
MSDALIDFASLDSAVATAEPAVDSAVTEPVVDAPVDAPVVDEPAAPEAGKETETHNVDGSEKSDEEKATFKT